MLFAEHPVVVRGGGDLASGVVVALGRAGFPVTVLELEQPLAIRRTVSFAMAIVSGTVEVEGLIGRRVADVEEADRVSAGGGIAVLASEGLPEWDPARVVVDARMAKRPLDTTKDDGAFVVALGPGHVAGVHCDAVIETMRGHRLGRVIWDGPAEPDTGVPGIVGGASADRVVHAATAGRVMWTVEIGDVVAAGQSIGSVGSERVEAPLGGVVRGLITPGFEAWEGLKIADIDPRADPGAVHQVSDKSRLVGAGVLEAILVWLNR